MGQKGMWKSITNTACVLGLISTMSFNGTILINGDYELPKAKYTFNNETSSNSMISMTSNIYTQNTQRQLENEAKALFGDMRDATKKEQECVSNYIDSIAKDTGVNFFDLC